MNIFNIAHFLGLNTSLTQTALQKSLWLMTMRFLLHGATVLGFTILISYFLSYFGSTQLPILFVLISFGTLIGTFATHALSNKFSVKSTLQYASIIITILIVSSFLELHYFNNYLLHLTISVGILFSIGVTQLNILFSMYVEKSFSPLESEEAFPIIESGEPLGGFISGIIAFTLPYFFHPESLLIGWAVLFFLFFVILHIKEFIHSDTDEEYIHSNNFLGCKDKKTKQSCIQNYYQLMQKNSLVTSLFFFVLLQSAGYILIEMIYAMSASILFEHADTPKSQLVQELSHGIGTFHAWVYGILFILQITIASKIQHFLGIIKSIFIQPFLQIFTTALSLLSGSFVIGLLGKGVYEVTGGISRNSYHSSFYVFSSHIREEIKEFLEGFARPIGMVIASLILMITSVILFRRGLGFNELYIFCSVFLIVCLIISFYFYSSMKHKYTQFALENLKNEESIEEIFDAIEILSQNGHKNTIHILSKLLKEKNQSQLIQKKILEAFGELQKDPAIPDLLWALHNSNKDIQLSAVKAFGKYKSLKKRLINQIFSRHKIINSLQNVFLYADSKKLRLAVIKVFKDMQHPQIASFLIKTLSKNNNNINIEKDERDTIFCAILGCSYFNDISIAYYIQPFLKSEDSYLKSASIIALWQFNRYRKDLETHILEMLNSEDNDMKMSGIYTIGELKLYSFLPQLHTIFDTNKDNHIQKHCLISLIKMGFDEHIPNVLNMMFHSDVHISSSTKKLLSSPGIEKKTKEFIENFIRKKVIEKISIILSNESHNFLEISTPSLQQLSTLYTLIHEEKIVHTISKIIESRAKL